MSTKSDSTLAELQQSEEFLAAELAIARAEGDAVRVRDLPLMITKLRKERLALAEKAGKLISLEEAKTAYATADDLLLKALWEVAPDQAPDVLERMAQLMGLDDGG